MNACEVLLIGVPLAALPRDNIIAHAVSGNPVVSPIVVAVGEAVTLVAVVHFRGVPPDCEARSSEAGAALCLAKDGHLCLLGEDLLEVN